MYILVVAYSKHHDKPRIFVYNNDDEVDAIEWVGAQLGEEPVYNEDEGTGESTNYTYDASYFDSSTEIYF